MSPCEACGWKVEPARTEKVVRVTQSHPAALFILGGAFLLTLLFAFINTWEEEIPMLSQGGILLVLLAGLSQIPGVLLAFMRYKNNSTAMLPPLVAAFLIAGSGVLAYCGYALNGKADSIDTAAHLHVVAFPIMHCVFAFAVYLLSGIASMLIYFARR